ncbi:type I glyceraldehyde-3-phosphate dehydrogenase [candidate division WWE3 bacterium]|nr:type I glyceraldehyde-3-phosphate dehydrogenase [candidate division WWE3 bacterium]
MTNKTAQTPKNTSKKTRVAINGFGRIGRASFKILLSKPNVEIVAVNDLTNPRILAHLLKHDSAYGTFNAAVSLVEDSSEVSLDSYRGDKAFYAETASETSLIVDGVSVQVLSEPNPEKLPWKDLDIDVVLECTGRFVKDGASYAHIKAGAKKVVLSAPAKGECKEACGAINTYLMGVNAADYQGEQIVSNASCTTNCIAPVVQIMKNAFGVKKSAMTTIHAVTASQNIVDGPHKDMRRARAAGYNIIPTTTGAALATTKVIPELEGVFDGMAMRVPVLTGSASDITFLLEQEVTVEQIQEAFVKAAESEKYKGVVDYSYKPLVSSDIVGSSFSSIVDLNMTKVVDGDLVKVLAWYDNEWGYSNRLVDLALLVAGFSQASPEGFSIV